MSKLLVAWHHFKTITMHRILVMQGCFKMGLYWQGLTHDLSKYSLKELSIYKYYTGTESPHKTARRILGFSPSWLYHKAKNKHHWEYWTDNNSNQSFKGVKVPYKYVIEMFCDFIGAGKAYMKESWSQEEPLKYFNARKDSALYHEDTKALLQKLFEKLAIYGEKGFLEYYKSFKSILKAQYNAKQGG